MLTPNNVYNDVVTGWDIGVSVYKHDDLAESVVISTVHLNVPVAEAVAYKITRQSPGSKPLVEAIAQSEIQGKDNAAFPIIFKNGDLWFCVAEAAPAQSGTTSKIDIYEYIGAFPPVSTTTVPTVDQTARNTANQALALSQSTSVLVGKILNALKQICGIS